MPQSKVMVPTPLPGEMVPPLLTTMVLLRSASINVPLPLTVPVLLTVMVVYSALAVPLMTRVPPLTLIVPVSTFPTAQVLVPVLFTVE